MTKSGGSSLYRVYLTAEFGGKLGYILPLNIHHQVYLTSYATKCSPSYCWVNYGTYQWPAKGTSIELDTLALSRSGVADV